nr:MAG TPA: hypothetical protein [Caudoviricetes sp.]
MLVQYGITPKQENSILLHGMLMLVNGMLQIKVMQ